MEQQLANLLEAQPIIAAVRDEQGLNQALEAPVDAIFLLDAMLNNLKKRVRRIEEHGKLAFVHIEMVAGLSKDQAALEFLKEEIAPTGVITTKPSLVQSAKNLGLVTIQRLFILDSLSLQTGLRIIQSHHPDFIEVMPGVIPKAITEMKAHCQVPIIAGGMIKTKEEIIELLRVGAVGVSTSRAELWDL
ncbi:glycerol uptake operon antiterminator [Hydrogenispora ethanolica]|jgi:glycerol uptake operon antiterminator|uniref:Glycerol uptake operon antiterminator n=1 Tax=Hydrogenispora ethanolica TaxID=1082276 RepID=A0A4R1S1B0_HYDET|nr:glycerol-3-phosphate responsive antiterminator [Hydrogenispora ethanolica]TCL72330.1 glycerol uptake operon antiterminator [Hydrogenispora ethanolica]